MPIDGYRYAQRSDGVFALGLVNALLEDPAYSKNVPAPIAEAVRGYSKARADKEAGVGGEVFDRVLALLRQRSPSLVLSGPSAEGYIHGAQNAAAIMLLNVVSSNIGKTITAPAKNPFPQIAPAEGDTAALSAFNDGLAQGRFQTVFTYSVNPAFTAPGFMKLRENLKKAQFKVAAHYRDETAEEADLILPDSAMEDWGTHLASYQPDGVQLHMQQPLMERLYPDSTRSLGDVLLTLLKQRHPDEYKQWPDYYAYLKSAIIQNKPSFRRQKTMRSFGIRRLRHGVLSVKNAQEQRITPDLKSLNLALPGSPEQDGRLPLPTRAIGPLHFARWPPRKSAMAAGNARSLTNRPIIWDFVDGNTSGHSATPGDKRRRYHRNLLENRLS